MKHKVEPEHRLAQTEKYIDACIAKLEKAHELLAISIMEYQKLKEQMGDIIEMKELMPTYFTINNKVFSIDESSQIKEIKDETNTIKEKE